MQQMHMKMYVPSYTSILRTHVQAVPYAYGHFICVLGAHNYVYKLLIHNWAACMHAGWPTNVWDVPYRYRGKPLICPCAYESLYAYWYV